MINIYKYTKGLYDTKCPGKLATETRTRGHQLKLAKIGARTNVRLHFFTSRTVNWWNNLPEEVVTAPSMNCFKSRFDNHFKDHPVVYNFKALDNPLCPTMSVN